MHRQPEPGFGLFANRLEVSEKSCPGQTWNGKKVEATVKINSPASSAGKKAPFSSQLQNWVKDEGVDTRKMDPAKATKFYKLKDWRVSPQSDIS